MDVLSQIMEFLEEGNEEKVFELTKRAIELNLAPKVILDNSLIAGMDFIGEQFRKQKIFLPHVLLAARAMYAGMDQLRPLLIKEGIPSLGKIIIGTVKGDLHDIGKNLVGIMLQGAGFELIDLGTDVPPETFIQVAEREQASVIGMSALLTTTMPMMGTVTDLLAKSNLGGAIKTIVRGAPLSEEFAHVIGADSYAPEAASAVVRVKELIGDA